MEANYGILSVIPAIIVIGLALYTKKTVISLLIGTFIGVTILNGWNPLVAVVSFFRDYLYPNVTSVGNMKTIIIIFIIQGFVRMLKVTGAGVSIARWTRKYIKSKRSAEVTTCASGFAFIYTEPNFVLGAVMRPVTEAFNVARVKLAYITDSLGCNMAALSPVCSYGPYYTGLIAAELAALGIAGDAWGYYWKYIPNNLYAILAILVAYYVAASGKDIGPMYLAERRADKTGRLLGPKDDPMVKDLPGEKFEESEHLPLRNFAIPKITMFIALFASIFYTGNIVENGLQVFTKCDVTTSIIIGFAAASFASIIVGTVQKRFSFMKGFEMWTGAFSSGFEAVLIIALAWCLSSVSGNLGLKYFIAGIVDSVGVSPALIPAIIYLAGCVISFASGSSWGTTALLMPVAVPVCYEYGVGIEIAVAACVAGGLFGDHCSPVSDTSIKASMAAGCDHIQHVRTQLPYALTSGISAFIAFIVSGLTNNTLLGVAVALCLALIAINVQHKMAVKKYGDYDFSGEEINPNLVEE